MSGAMILSALRNFFESSMLLLGLALFFGLSLGAAQVMLEPRIRANQLAETTGQIPSLIPGAVSGEAVNEAKTEFRGMNADGKTLGWVVQIRGNGFSGPIDCLLGLSEDRKTVTGLYVLSQSETPGLGTRITKPEWLAQFIGCQVGKPVVLGKDVDGLSGATISSRAVVDVVDRNLNREKPL